MRLSKWQIFILGLVLILSVFYFPRLYWLGKSKRTIATVLYIEETHRSRQTYPVFEYYTVDSRVVSRGSYNLPYNDADSVVVLYNPDDVLEVKVDDFKGHWIDRIMWLVPVLFVWILIFVPRDFDFSISLINRKLSVNFG